LTGCCLPWHQGIAPWTYWVFLSQDPWESMTLLTIDYSKFHIIWNIGIHMRHTYDV
jgi:hypothetical protein